MNNADMIRWSRDKTATVSVRVHPDINAMLKKQAQAARVSMAAYITLLIAEAAERDKEDFIW